MNNKHILKSVALTLFVSLTAVAPKVTATAAPAMPEPTQPMAIAVHSNCIPHPYPRPTYPRPIPGGPIGNPMPMPDSPIDPFGPPPGPTIPIPDFEA